MCKFPGFKKIYINIPYALFLQQIIIFQNTSGFSYNPKKWHNFSSLPLQGVSKICAFFKSYLWSKVLRVAENRSRIVTRNLVILKCSYSTVYNTQIINCRLIVIVLKSALFKTRISRYDVSLHLTSFVDIADLQKHIFLLQQMKYDMEHMINNFLCLLEPWL